MTFSLLYYIVSRGSRTSKGEIMSREDIVVASNNRTKLDAVEWACRRVNRMAQIRGVETGSALTEHPIGVNTTLEVATRRAEEAHKQFPDSPVVAIQKGILCFGDRQDKDELVLYGIVVIKSDGTSLRAITGISRGIETSSLALPRALMSLLSAR
ncbi:MAG: inosine/xanthosine triphosphatase [Candidatus Zambryskibacteria bacterium]|nr:inosine/xanthosine triphosphatase [Candidatus Zambryskibacteria bacterium]